MTRREGSFGRKRKARPGLDRLAKVHRQEMSIAERKLWTALRGSRFEGFKFRRQHPIGRFIADFACIEVKLVIEVDGESHDLKTEEDDKRTNLLRALGFEVIRFTNESVLFQFEAVLEDLFEACVRRVRTPSPQPSPPSTGARGSEEGNLK